jgi:hypothetical protein
MIWGYPDFRKPPCEAPSILGGKFTTIFAGKTGDSVIWKTFIETTGWCSLLKPDQPTSSHPCNIRSSARQASVATKKRRQSSLCSDPARVASQTLYHSASSPGDSGKLFKLHGLSSLVGISFVTKRELLHHTRLWKEHDLKKTPQH